MSANEKAGIVTSYIVGADGRGWYMASSSDANGPQSLLKRATEEQAIADGAAYLAANWGRNAKGEWTPYPSEWVNGGGR